MMGETGQVVVNLECTDSDLRAQTAVVPYMAAQESSPSSELKRSSGCSMCAVFMMCLAVYDWD